MAIVGVALNKYYISKGESPGVITLSLPASFKGTAESADKLQLYNDLSPLFIFLRISENINEVLETIKE